jgi:hypothetical protein
VGIRLPLIDNAPARHYGWAGILGQDLLGRFPVVLDMKRGQVHLLPPESGTEAIEAHLTETRVGDGRWSVLEIEFKPCPYLPLSVTDEPDGRHEMLIDTGASNTSFSREVIEALDLEPVGSYRARSIAGEFEGLTYRMEGMGLFGLNISTDVQDTSLDHGMMGMDVLGELVVVFDRAGGHVWLHLRENEDDADAGEAGD